MEFSEAVFIGSFYHIEQLPRNGFPHVAFAGRSNVGKSSLLNRILNRKNLAQVAKTPGKTRALNFYEIDRRYYFVDLPGFGFAKISKDDQDAWKKLIDLYFTQSDQLKGVIHIIDSRRGLADNDLDLVEYLDKPQTRALWVLSKSDKLSTSEKKNIYQETLNRLGCSPKDLVFFSAVDGTGVVELRKQILDMLKQ
jgi:GTP-binding protein